MGEIAGRVTPKVATYESQDLKNPMILAQSEETSNEILMAYKKMRKNELLLSPSSQLARRRNDFPDVK